MKKNLPWVYLFVSCLFIILILVLCAAFTGAYLETNHGMGNRSLILIIIVMFVIYLFIVEYLWMYFFNEQISMKNTPIHWFIKKMKD